jgi:hypothetical protein
MLIQQGDVLLKTIESIPDSAKAYKNTHVAEGEATGHYHDAQGEGLVVLEKYGTLYVQAPNGGKIIHQEHKEVTLPPGNYQVDIVREYDHFEEEARRVMD